MELWKQNLDKVLEKIQIGQLSKLSKKRKLKIVYDIACGLQMLHQSDIIHLDLKPSNILLNDKLDEAVIIDYGVSKLKKSLAGETLTNTQISGITYAYASLEQCLLFQGQLSYKVKPAYDIWALGIIMYEVFSEKKAWLPWHLSNNEKNVLLLNQQFQQYKNSLNKKTFWDFNVRENDVLDNAVTNIIDKCIVFDENQRKSIDEIKNSIEELYNKY